MTFDEMVRECRRLRALAEAAETAFFMFLMKCETEMGEIWKGAGHETFESFLRSADFGSEVNRYYNYVRGAKRLDGDADRILKIGVPTVVRIGRPEKISHTAVRALSERAEAFAEVHGVAPKEQTVTGWAKEVSASESDPRIFRQRSELQQLREENAKLKAENAKLKVELNELRKKSKKKAA